MDSFVKNHSLFIIQMSNKKSMKTSLVKNFIRFKTRTAFLGNLIGSVTTGVGYKNATSRRV